MADHMRAELVVDALQMALARRRPGLGSIHHTDQGSQYVSLWRSASTPATPASRSRWAAAATAYDNAVAESFFATLKKELVHRRSWPTRRELIGEVFEYIEAFYNPTPAALDAGLPLAAAVRASRFALRDPNEKIKLRTRPNQPCPLKRGHSTVVVRDRVVVI